MTSLDEEEINAARISSNSNNNNNNEPNDKDCNEDEQGKAYIHPPLTDEQKSPYFTEELYIGNLHIVSDGDRFHRWIMFISTSNKEIIPPVSIKSVTYDLLPSFHPSTIIKKDPPFFLDRTGWGTFELELKLVFKDIYLRSNIATTHVLSFDSPTTIHNIHNDIQRSLSKLLEFEHFKPYTNKKVVKYEGKQAKKLFIKKTGDRLVRNLSHLPAILTFNGFRYRLDEFIDILKEPNMLTNSLRIAESNLYLIAQYSLLCNEYGLQDLIHFNSSLLFDQCFDCDINITSAKVKHITIRDCENVCLQFTNCMCSCEMHKSRNITIKCNGDLFHYRFDGCKDCHLFFVDTGKRTTFMSFDSQNMKITAMNVLWMDNSFAVRKIERNKKKALKLNDLQMDDECKNYDEEIVNRNGELMLMGKEDEPSSDDYGMEVDNDLSRCIYLEYDIPYEIGPWERSNIRWRSHGANQPRFNARVFKPSIGFGRE